MTLSHTSVLNDFVIVEEWKQVNRGGDYVQKLNFDQIWLMELQK